MEVGDTDAVADFACKVSSTVRYYCRFRAPIEICVDNY